MLRTFLIGIMCLALKNFCPNRDAKCLRPLYHENIGSFKYQSLLIHTNGSDYSPSWIWNSYEKSFDHPMGLLGSPPPLSTLLRKMEEFKNELNERNASFKDKFKTLMTMIHQLPYCEMSLRVRTNVK